MWVEKLGKKKPSAASIEAKDAYLLGLLETEEKRLTWKKDEAADTNSTAEAPKTEPAKAEPKSVPTATPEQAFEPVPTSSEDDDDDLPF